MVSVSRATDPSSTATRRLRHLQLLCAESGLDALLFVPGIDGGEAPGSHQVISYLFQGRGGRDLLDSVHLTEELEDVVLTVYPDRVGLYCSPSAAETLQPLYAGLWEGLALHCPTAEEQDDPDEAEEVKIQALVRMLTGTKRVGIPLVPAKGGADPMQVETWPLFQAYGLEGIGRSGFFTMNFEISDIHRPLQKMFAHLDATDIATVVNRHVPMMAQHWEEMMAAVDSRRAPDRLDLTERQVGEALLSYFAYGTLRPVAGVARLVTMGPRVVFGARTNDDTSQTSAVRLADAGLEEGIPARHMVVEAADPRSPLRCARSYLLCQGQLATDGLSPGQEQTVESDETAAQFEAWSGTDARQLAHLYAALVRCAKASIRHFALDEGASVHSARQVAVGEFTAACAGYGCDAALPEGGAEEALRFALWGCDHANRVSPEPKRGDRQLKVLRVACAGVRSEERPGELLGGLVYADTFLELGAGPADAAALLGGVPEGLEGAGGGGLIVLTDTIPEVAAWAAAGAEYVSGIRAERALQRMVAQTAPSNDDEINDAKFLGVLGPPLDVGGGSEDIMLLTGCELLPAVAGRWYPFTRGFVFCSPRLPPVVVNLAGGVEAVYLSSHEGRALDGEGVAGNVVFRCSSPSAGVAPMSYLSDSKFLGVALGSLRTSARRQAMREIIPAWQQQCTELDVPFSTVAAGAPSVLPPALHDAHAYAAAFPPYGSAPRPPLMQRASGTAAFQRAVDAMFARSSFKGALGLRPRLPDALARPPAEQHKEAPALPPSTPITVLLGLPGGCAEMVAETLVRFLSTNREYHVVAGRLGGEGGCAVTAAGLEASLSDAARAAGSRAQEGAGAAAGSEQHVLVVVSAHQGAAEVLGLIAGTSAVREGQLRVGCVTACVRGDNVFEERRQPMPGLLEQTTPGLVDAIAFVGGEGPSLAAAQQLLRAHNPLARVSRAGHKGGELLHDLEALVATAAHIASPSPEQAHALRFVSALPVRRYQGGGGAVREVVVRFRGQLDLGRLQAELAAPSVSAPGADEAAAAVAAGEERDLLERPPDHVRRVFSLRGHVRRARGAPVDEVQAVRRSSFHVAPCAWVDMPVVAGTGGRGPFVELACHDEPGGLMCAFGAGITAADLASVIRRCGVPAPPAVKPRDRASLTPQERRSIQLEHREDPLPDGWLYNGATYVDIFGDTAQVHPRFEEFADDFLADKNAAIAEENARLRAERAAVEPLEVLL